MKIHLLLCFVIFLFSCRSEHENLTQNRLVNTAEKAHKKADFIKHEAIRFRLDLTFGGKDRFNGTISQLTNSSKIRLDYDNGLTLIYDNKKVYQSPDTLDYPKARFDVFTWAYFFSLPYKLTDSGTQWSSVKKDTLNGSVLNSSKLTFTAETGDSPEDWYFVYQNDSTQLLEAAAYIVTLNKSLKQAEEDPHAIKYENYMYESGIPFATKWSFWSWDKKEGLTKLLGEGHLSNFEFFTPEDGYFSKLGNSKEVSL